MTFDGAKIADYLQTEKRKSLFVCGKFPNFLEYRLSKKLYALKYTRNLFVFVMSLNLDHEHGDDIIVDVIDDTVMGRNMSRPCYILATFQRFRMAKAGTRMIHQLMIDFLVFLPKLRVRLLPLPDNFVCVCRYFNIVHAYIDSK